MPGRQPCSKKAFLFAHTQLSWSLTDGGGCAATAAPVGTTNPLIVYQPSKPFKASTTTRCVCDLVLFR
jgi:hypothetical protein